ncbi:MAG: hypothetical protein HY927_15185 [Elusimicrobia bacterium]|nr:hypothetical protein [Elusimicrobiota bacterium]
MATFTQDAESFSRLHGSAWVFRYLGWFVGCRGQDLDFLVRKLYCEGLPGAHQERPSLSRAAARLLAHPFYYLISKSWLWRGEPRVDFQLETVDPAHFQRFLAPIYAGLDGAKRIAPSRLPFPDPGATRPISSSISPRSLLFLFGSPWWIPALWRLSRRHGTDLLGAFRRAMGIFAVMEGHFHRYPCRHFITYSDETNHPCRYLGFKRHCAGSLVLIQNAERGGMNLAAYYGMADCYLAFGAYVGPLVQEMGSRIGRVVPVGSLTLNSHHAPIEALRRSAAPALYDLLVIDQGLDPDDLTPRYASAMEKLLINAGELKRRRPAYRIAYQLRHYAAPAAKDATVEKARRHLGPGVVILDNKGAGEVYQNLFLSKLAVTFASTCGFEAFFLRRGLKTLFVNYTGDPVENICPDPRFQLCDAKADYDLFEARVSELLAADIADIPESARARHLAFDGKVSERIVSFLKPLASG